MDPYAGYRRLRESAPALLAGGHIPRRPGGGHSAVTAIPAGSQPAAEPRHTTHGFQYVSITGARELNVDDVTGVMVHTDLRRTGWFCCSDQRLNALHEATVVLA